MLLRAIVLRTAYAIAALVLTIGLAELIHIHHLSVTCPQQTVDIQGISMVPRIKNGATVTIGIGSADCLALISSPIV